MRRPALVFSALFAVSACEAPSPDALRIVPRAGPLEGATASLVEGDLLVLDLEPVDGDERMDLCVEASAPSSSSITVRRVRGRCRRFVVLATRAGTARVRFASRGTTADLEVDVTAVP